MNRSELQDATLSELVMALRTASPGREYDRIENEALGRIEALRKDVKRFRAFAEEVGTLSENLEEGLEDAEEDL